MGPGLAVDRVGVPSSDLGTVSVDLFLGSALWGRSPWQAFFGEPSGMTSMARPDRERPNGPDTRPRTSEVVPGFMVSELGPPFDVSWSCCGSHHGPGGFLVRCGLVWCCGHTCGGRLCGGGCVVGVAW